MIAERWRRVQDLFHDAVEKPSAERHAWLEAQCGGDRELLAEVLQLIAADEDSGDLLSNADALLARLADDVVNTNIATAAIGRRIGPYTIRQLLGHGGMGAVYLADRSDVGMRCALKLVRGAFAAPHTIKRFLLERRVLARLQHPNIARMLDAGVTDDGTPWFAMELVEGRRIDEYCNEHHLTVAARLQLFERVCDAVAYAHRNLIVHRDLKPANILVTEASAPKLLDFGIAKLLEEQDDDLTRAGVSPQTPAYAAPEQAHGDVITTATDVFALGVVLQELVNGTKHSPSRDLDAIIARAQAPEPERRYGSAAELLDDLVRYRQGLPVNARPDTWTYRARRFVRRNRLAVSAAALFVVLLGSFAGTMTVQQRATAREAAKARNVSDFLVDLFDATDPFSGSSVRTDSMSMRDFIVARGEKVAELKDQPEVQLQALNVVGHMYFSLGLYDRAQRMYEQARTLGTKLHPNGSEETVRTLMNIGDLQRITSDLTGSVATLAKALEQARALRNADATTGAVLNAYGDALRQAGKHKEAEPILREAVEVQTRLHGARSRQAADALNNLGLLLYTRGDHEQARPILEQALAVERVTLPAVHPQTSATLNNLGLVRKNLGDLRGAEAALREAMQIKRKIWGQKHWRIANGLNSLAGVLVAEDSLDAAEALATEALEVIHSQFGDKHELISASELTLGDIAEKRGDRKAAEQHFRLAVTSAQRALPPGHPRLVKAQQRLARFLRT